MKSITIKINTPELLRVFRWLSQFVWKDEKTPRPSLKVIHFNPDHGEHGTFYASNGRTMAIATLQHELLEIKLPKKHCTFLPLNGSQKELYEVPFDGNMPDFSGVIPKGTDTWTSFPIRSKELLRLIATINQKQKDGEGIDVGLLFTAIDKGPKEYWYSLPYSFSGMVKLKELHPIVLEFNREWEPVRSQMHRAFSRKALVMPIRMN